MHGGEATKSWHAKKGHPYGTIPVDDDAKRIRLVLSDHRINHERQVSQQRCWLERVFSEKVEILRLPVSQMQRYRGPAIQSEISRDSASLSQSRR